MAWMGAPSARHLYICLSLAKLAETLSIEVCTGGWLSDFRVIGPSGDAAHNHCEDDGRRLRRWPRRTLLRRHPNTYG